MNQYLFLLLSPRRNGNAKFVHGPIMYESILMHTCEQKQAPSFARSKMLTARIVKSGNLTKQEMPLM